MSVTVTVILPTFNRSSSLAASCRSVLDQSFRDLELIVVDDASTEDIKSVINTLDDPRIIYLRRDQNGGASAARNVGLKHARGRFIAFQDSDDLWLPGKLEMQVDLMETLPQDVGALIGTKIVYGLDNRYRYGHGKVVCSPTPGEALSLDEDQVRRFLTGNRISLQNCLFRRDCMPDEAWFDPGAKANADWEFSSRLAQHTKIYEDIRPVVVGFISEDSISRNPRKKALGMLRILKKNREAYARYPDVHASALLKLSVLMSQCGKPKLAARVFWMAMRTHPGKARDVARAVKKIVMVHVRRVIRPKHRSGTVGATVKP